MITNLNKKAFLIVTALIIFVAVICMWSLLAVAADSPDQIALSLTANTTAYQVRFRLPDNVTNTQYIEYVPSGDKDQPDQRVKLKASALPLSSSGYNVFTAKMSGLALGTEYAYRVGCKKVWSEWYYFKTPAADATGFDFLYMSDTQSIPEDGSYEEWGNLLQSALADFDPAFAVIGGDLVNNGSDPAEWADFFASASGGFDGVPLMSAIGNHDNDDFFSTVFALPKNGPAGYRETVYSFDYANAHIIVLDSNALGNDDNAAMFTDWLRKDLTRARDKTWKIVVQHHPYYTANANLNDEIRAETMRQYILPVLEKYGVDLVLCGHQHSYMRTYPMKDGEVSTHADGGILHLMNVSGPKQYSVADYDYIAASAQNNALYLKVSFCGHTLSITAKDVEGNTVDSYSWSKSK